MKFSQMFFVGVAILSLAGGGIGCSCQGGKAADDLNLFYNPRTIDFGTVPILSSRTIKVELKHAGTSGTIEIRSVGIDSGSDEFDVDGPDSMALAPEQSTVISITYAPQDSKDDGGYLVIRHNVPPLGETRIPITANGQLADLVSDPNPIDFGEVLGGTFKDLDVMLKNVGSDSVVIKQAYLDLEGSPDFTLQALVFTEGQTLPLVLKPQEQLGLVLRYEPRGSNDDQSNLVVEGETRGEVQPWAFEVLGSELGPKLVAAPGVIDYGWVPLQETRTQLLAITNEGNADLNIESVYVAPGSDANIVVADPPAFPVKVVPGGEQDFQVKWTATQAKPGNADPIGSLGILSNDSTSPTLIQVFGQVDAPFLSVIPTFVDLGYGPQKQTVTRMLTLRNDGHGPLNVSSLVITNLKGTTDATEFAFDIDPKYKTGPVGEWVAQGSESIPVTVKFTNKGAATGTVTADLVITSNSPGNGTVTVGLSVVRTGTPVCKVSLVPNSLSFGTVAEGFYKELPINLVNVGSGACSFQQARIGDCISMMGMTPTCQAPGTVAPSSIFQFAGLPAATKDGIAPGASVPIRIRFIPKNVASVWGQLTDFAGLLWIKVWDSHSGEYIELPAAPSGGLGTGYTPNLSGTGGIAKVSVMPDDVDFGLVTIGCFSQAQKVCVYNTGSVALKVSDIRFEGCTPEFYKRNVPPLPANVAPSVPFCFNLKYGPQDEGVDECMMKIASDDITLASLSVAMRGEGTYETHQTDTFQQVSGQDVDVLFVIDDSGSMCDIQDTLIENFASFIQASKIWNNNYHLGVISVNVVNDNIIGRLNRGNKNITPRYIVPNAQATTQLANLADLGCDGNSDAQEAGLQAAQAALSAPLTTDTGVACTTDDACRNDKNLCSDSKTCPYYCIEGTCGGWNKGFLRKDAQLEVIILSDEPDQSSSAPTFYIDFFKNIKGYYNVNMMHVNTIVQDGTCSYTDPQSGQVYELDADPRYLEVANQTGGRKGAICDPTFGTIMNEISAQAFGLKVQFYLTRLADPATVTVKVNGTACTSGWTYEASSNSVLFDEDGACMPQPGDEIVIDYETLCLTS